MTSVLRKYSLIDQRFRNFVVIADCSGWTLDSGASSSSLMEVSAFVDSFTSATIGLSQGYQLRDLGRQITVYNGSITGSPHIAIFRQMRVENGSGQEGVPTGALPVYYVCTWTDKEGAQSAGFGYIQAAKIARIG